VLPPESRASLPLPVRWMIERLLSKDPHDRYANTADLAADLRRIRDRGGDDASLAVGAGSTRRAVWLRRGLAASAIMGALIVGRALPSPSGNEFAQYRFTPFATDAGYQGQPAWSPDGKTLTYVAEVNGILQVFTKSRGSSRRQQVTQRAFDCHEPFWAADGSSIYFHSLARARESLWRIGVAGGEPELVQEGAMHAALSPDGKTLALLVDSGTGVMMTLSFASPPDAKPIAHAAVPGGILADGILRYSPDGSKLLAWMMPSITRRAEKGTEPGFWMMSLPAGEFRPVLPVLSGARVPPSFSWMPDNRQIVVVRNDGVTAGLHLWLADTSSGSLHALTLTNGNEGSPAVAPGGNEVAFSSEATDFDLILLPTDGGQPRSVLSSTRNELDPAWSPTAAEYAFVTDRSGAPEIWVRSEDGGFEDRIVGADDFGESTTLALGALAFSPDGRRIAYQRYGTDGDYKIWISPRAGGSPVRLNMDERYQNGPTWSPDGNWIAFGLGAPVRGLGKVAVGARSSAPTMLLGNNIPNFTRPQWSPDGKWILCDTVEGLVVTSPDGQQTRTISPEEWIAYVWNQSGTEVYGLRPADDAHRVMLVSLDVVKGTERVVNANVGTIPQANQGIRGLSRARGGLLTSIARVRSDVWLLEGLAPASSFLERLWPR
jgi:eukaryotic-like serine/threonine-protein kinase